MSNVRVRFAPSPTGYLHIGGLRTALYNYLFARSNGGEFLLRIEDTDDKRYVDKSVDDLIMCLNSLGIDYDYGPNKPLDGTSFFQSKRTDIYNQYIKKLIDNGDAYYCFCSPYELEEMRKEQKLNNEEDIIYNGKCKNLTNDLIDEYIRSNRPYTIRMNVKGNGNITFKDIIKDNVIVNTKVIDDQVLIKSDGKPTYHFASVVDDHLMGITHVIRGEEWLNSTPKHLMLYDMLEFKPPEFAHIPLILNTDRSKLSKRNNDATVTDYLNKGFIKECILNYVSTVGWTPPNRQEIMSLTEMINLFKLEDISKSSSMIDINKFKWMNKKYINNINNVRISEMVEWLTGLKLNVDAIDIVKPFSCTLKDIVENSKWAMSDITFTKDDEEYIQGSKQQFILNKLYLSIQDSNTIEDFLESIKEVYNYFIEKLDTKPRDYYFSIRLVLYGNRKGPDFPNLVRVLGVE